ncbi:glutathione ABC transporter permease GsiD [Desulfosarcina ovata subsp. ovata]|uniref:Glutathione ABC transporter permease GsiD n=2 Tax=Desulfosarcina ovata TaxID=83564 RepID=A0A5K8AAJ3_9BACT|nr:glutathione ABC transporter permease GsiD [Desulfosarcina ovata subsp. ovata]
MAPVFSPYDPLELNLGARLLPPSINHPMGTDAVGRDMLSRIIYGTRISLVIAAVVVFFETLIGLIVGTAAGYFGKLVDELLMRLVDILLAFPGIILSLAIVGIRGASPMNLIVALSSVGWGKYARLFRGTILAVKEEPFIESARAIGCGKLRIACCHMLPNIVSPIIVLATMNMGTIIISTAGLSFIGLGIQAPTPEWGVMLNEAKPFMETYPHLMIFPGLMIMVTVMAFNFLGDGLRDLFDLSIQKIGT